MPESRFDAGKSVGLQALGQLSPARDKDLPV
jgi:hypothetical protein